jgi:hypothetical protein
MTIEELEDYANHMLLKNMNLMQKIIILSSYRYYNLYDPRITDSEYDEISRRLADYVTSYPELFKQTRFYYAMEDFDGATGMGIYEALTEEDRQYIRGLHGGGK